MHTMAEAIPSILLVRLNGSKINAMTNPIIGGKQVINFLDGYATPLECRSGLMYMSLLSKPTDHDLEEFPHVLVTSPHEGDPPVLGYTHPKT